MDRAFGIIPKTSSLCSRLSRLSPILSSRSFIVLHFKSVIHIELILMKGVRLSRIIFPCGCLVVPAPFVEKTVFFSLVLRLLLLGMELGTAPFWSPVTAPFPFAKDLQTPDGGAS